MEKKINNMEAKYKYVSLQEKSQVKELAEVEINNRVLKCPFYGVIVRSNLDISCLRDVINTGKLKNTQTVAYNLGDAEAFQNQITKTLFEFTGEKLTHRPFSEFIITIDPNGEYLVHNVASEVNKLMQIPDIPNELKQLLRQDTQQRMRTIKSIFDDESKLSRLVEWYLKKSINLNAEVNIPICLPISGETTLRYAIKTNRLATTMQQDNGWQKSVFFLLDFKSFRNDSIINRILSTIYFLKPNIVVFKILNPGFLEPNAVLERTTLQMFLEGLYQYRLKEKALTFGLNCDVSLYHYMAQGLCGAIEPISGNYNPDVRYHGKKLDLDSDTSAPNRKHGKFPDPITLEEKPFEVLKRISKNTGQPYPCNCHECSSYSSILTNSIEHNKMRRRHRVYIRDKFVSELIDSFTQRNIRASMFDRFSEEGSQLSVFRANYS